MHVGACIRQSFLEAGGRGEWSCAMARKEPARLRRQKALLVKEGATRAGSLNRATHTVGRDIASAAVLPLGAATGQVVTVTGSEVITSASETPEGTITRVTFSGTPTLTHDPAALILESAANIAVQAGDTAEFESLGAGNYRVRNYTRASGAALVPSVGCSVVGRATNTSGDTADITIAETEILARRNNVVDGYTLDDFADTALANTMDDRVIFSDTSDSNKTKSIRITDFLGFGATHIIEGRLSLTDGVSVTTADVTGASTIYFTPHTGRRISLPDPTSSGTIRLYYLGNTLSIVLSSLTSGLPYDLFIYDNAGTVVLDKVAWTNGTTRAVAIARDTSLGYWTGTVNSSIGRYVGTFYSTSTTTTEDSAAKRLLFNAHNRVRKSMIAIDTTDSWNYSTASYQQANASTANQLAMMRGLDEDSVDAFARSAVLNSTATLRGVRTGIGLDSTTANSATVYDRDTCENTKVVRLSAAYVGYPGVGYHYLAWLEFGGGADTQTWRGDEGGIRQCGIHGTVFC